MSVDFEDIDFLEHFSGLDDPRQEGEVLYPLDGILLLTLIAVLGGAEDWVDVALFWPRRREGGDPHDFGLEFEPGACPGPAQGGRQIQRDHGDPRTA